MPRSEQPPTPSGPPDPMPRPQQQGYRHLDPAGASSRPQNDYNEIPARPASPSPNKPMDPPPSNEAAVTGFEDPGWQLLMPTTRPKTILRGTTWVPIQASAWTCTDPVIGATITIEPTDDGRWHAHIGATDRPLIGATLHLDWTDTITTHPITDLMAFDDTDLNFDPPTPDPHPHKARITTVPALR